MPLHRALHPSPSPGSSPVLPSHSTSRNLLPSMPPPDLVPQQRRQPLLAVAWMAVNTLATVGIVFVNKAIFSDPSWRLAQLSFASFHFFVTWITLCVLSRPRLDYFVPRRASVYHLLPLAVAMCLNVIIPNLSLAFSSVAFYQVARILLTPTVALINFVLYRATLPPLAMATLAPACFGVALVSYYDSLPIVDLDIQTTSVLGLVFSLLGVLASSLYTVWIASYHRKLRMSSMQLLYNQAPIASFMLFYVIPLLDTVPRLSTVSAGRWFMIFLSGVFASLINISQFFIVVQTGPVSSTIVGHFKTCTVVCMGWAMSGRPLGDRALAGVLMAVAAIIAYSIIMLEHSARKPG